MRPQAPNNIFSNIFLLTALPGHVIYPTRPDVPANMEPPDMADPHADIPSPPPPDPPQDRDAASIPANIAQLLYVVRILLEYGRHLAATIERRAAAPGFILFATLFGTARIPVILACLNRGILRATALESLLLKRAATGRDLAVAPPRIRTAANASPANASARAVEQPLAPQTRRLDTERAQHDAPIDPGHLPTLKEIEAQIRSQSVGRNITDICRDMGVVPGLCTRTFWDALMGAIVYYQGNLSDLWNDQPRRLQQLRQEQEASASEQQDSSPEHKIPSTQQEIPSPQPIDLQVALHPERTLGFRIGEPPVDPSGESPAQPDTGSRNVSGQQHDSAATGPPPPPAMKRAA